jgi:protein-disulfide isomerase
VLEAYPKQVKLVFKQYPLPYHLHARPAALASLAARRQKKFWEMHDRIFENQGALADAQGKTRFSEFARQIGLNVEQFQKDVQDPALEEIIAKDLRDGADAQVRGTPTLYVNGRKATQMSLEELKKMVDAELAGSAKPSRPGK